MPVRPAGSLDLGPIALQWKKLDLVYAEVTKCDKSWRQETLTARRTDHLQPAGHRSYIFASNHLESGMEHVRALQLLLFSEHGATPNAPWTLARSIFESGFWATWLLEPNDGPERRERGLRAAVQDHRQRDAFLAEWLRSEPADLATVRADHAKHLQTYQDEAAQMSLDWDQLWTQKVNILEQLRKLRAITEMPAEMRGPAVGVWRALSGLQHGYSYALMFSSDTTDHIKIEGGFTAIVSIRDEVFHAFVGAATGLLIGAMSLYIDRSRKLPAS